MINKILSCVSLAISSVLVAGMIWLLSKVEFHWENINYTGLLVAGIIVLSMVLSIVAVIINIRKSNKILRTVTTLLALSLTLFISWGIIGVMNTEFCGGCGGSSITWPSSDLPSYDGWKTYTNKKLGVEFKYPPQFVADVDSTDEALHFVNTFDCRHDVDTLTRNENYCYNFTLTFSKTEIPYNTAIVKKVGVKRISGHVYENWSSGGTFTHNTIVKKGDGWYVFGYFLNSKAFEVYPNLQNVYYDDILSTVNFIK